MKTLPLLNGSDEDPQAMSTDAGFEWSGNGIFYWVATSVLGIQAIVLFSLSLWLDTHFDLTKDFALFYQGWFLIANGHINPYLSLISLYYWQNHLEWIMWPLSLLYFIYPHALTLLVAQDLAIIGSEVAAIGLMRDLIRHQRGSESGSWWWLQWLGLLMIVLNPWTYWATMFDFHFQSFEAFFLTAAVWQFYRRQVFWGYVFTFLCFVTGNVSITFLVPLGVLLLVWRKWRDGAFIVALGIAGFLLEEHIFYHGLGGFGITVPTAATATGPGIHASSPVGFTFGSFVQLLSSTMNSMWSGRLNIYANLAPTGLLGVFSPIGLLIPGLVLAESSLGGSMFSQPGWQNIGAYALLSVGTIALLAQIARRSMLASKIIASLVVINMLAWSVIGIIGLKSRTAVPDTLAAATLQQLRQTIPSDAEVVASQSIIGRFAARQYVYEFGNSGSLIPIHAKSIYLIISPYNGIDMSPVDTELARIDFLAHQRGFRLIAHRGDIWAFVWNPPRRQKFFAVGGDPMMLSAWSVKSASGYPVLSGPVSSWHMTDIRGHVGYVVAGAYWRLLPAIYRLSVKLTSPGPVSVEVWNTTGNQLLLRRTLPASVGSELTVGDFSNQQQFPRKLFNGWGPFAFQPISPLLYNQIEVRMWTNGQSGVDAYSIAMKQIGSVP